MFGAQIFRSATTSTQFLGHTPLCLRTVIRRSTACSVNVTDCCLVPDIKGKMELRLDNRCVFTACALIRNSDKRLNNKTVILYCGVYKMCQVLPCSRVSVPDFSLQMRGFDPRPVLVRNVAGKMALEQFSHQVFRFSPVFIFPPTSHAQSFASHQHCMTMAVDSVV